MIISMRQSYGAVLWGKKSDIVLIYEVIKDRNRIVDVDFNLIDKMSLTKTMNIYK